MVYVNPMNPATPADGDVSSQGDDRIREAKAAWIERLSTIFTDINVDPLVFRAGVIAGAALVNASVDTLQLKDAAVTTPKIKDDAVTDAKINGMDGAKLTDNTVTGPKLVNDSVTGAKLANDSVDVNKLANNAVTTAKIADDAVTNVKILDAVIELVKLSAAAKGKIAVTKSVDINVVTAGQGSDSNTVVGSAAFPGAAIGDQVTIGFPDVDTWSASDKTNTWLAYVDAADHVTLIAQNNTGGAKNWPTATIKLYITKSASAWGVNL